MQRRPRVKAPAWVIRTPQVGDVTSSPESPSRPVWVLSIMASLVGLILVGDIACMSPAQRWRERATGLGFTTSVIEGTSFRHVVIEKLEPSPGLVHVYLDGDGTPWRGQAPAPDPTPRNTLVLELMTMDSTSTLYLGRPCHHGLSDDAKCLPLVWTMQRYSQEVVSSMATALGTIVQARKIDRLAWIGYSGGGVLAMLLASKFPQTVAVITVAANLDIEAWADHHGYLRLSGSLNPAARCPLTPSIYQRHYVGGRDRVVPPHIVANAGVEPSQLSVLPNYDHVCCWRGIWPSILADLDRGIASRQRVIGHTSSFLGSPCP